jgi:hypothetical protein
LSCPDAIALTGFEYPADMLPADLLQREWLPGISRPADLGSRFLQVFRQIVRFAEKISEGQGYSRISQP